MVDIQLLTQTDANQVDTNNFKEIEVSGNSENMPEVEQQDASDHQPDAELVEQVRGELRAEFEANPNLYAEAHYEDLMSAKSTATCWRYLAHCNKRPGDAVELMKSALVWRKENEVDELKPDELAKEFWHLAPINFTGKTKDNRDVLYVLGKNYRKPSALLKDTVRRFVMYTLFNWDSRHREDLEKFVIVFDVTDTGLRNIDLDFMTWLVSIRDFIPARFHRIYVVGIPFVVRPVIRLIISWLSDNFRSIVHCGTFEQLVEPSIEPHSLPVEIGDQRDETYRLAPPEAPWVADSCRFADAEMLKAVEDSMGFSVTAERRDKLREMQLEFERRTTNAKIPDN